MSIFCIKLTHKKLIVITKEGLTQESFLTFYDCIKVYCYFIFQSLKLGEKAELK